MPTKTTTLRVKTPLLNRIKAWCFCSWDNGGIQLQMILQIAPHIRWSNQGYTMHKKSHDVLNYTMHTKMSMLEEWRQTKTSSVTLTTSIFHALETLYILFNFRFHIYAIDYLDSCFDHFITSFVIWIGRQWKPKLSLFKVYSVFVCNCTWICNTLKMQPFSMCINLFGRSLWILCTWMDRQSCLYLKVLPILLIINNLGRTIAIDPRQISQPHAVSQKCSYSISGRGDFWLGIFGWDPSVCKSNQLHVDILRLSFIKLECIL